MGGEKGANGESQPVTSIPKGLLDPCASAVTKSRSVPSNLMTSLPRLCDPRGLGQVRTDSGPIRLRVSRSGYGRANTP
jgi:hypothetical protein